MKRCKRSCQLMTAVAVGLYLTSVAVAQQARNARAPAYFRKLGNLGHVELTFHDPKKHEMKDDGKAYFKYKFNHKVKFKFKWRGADEPDKLLLTITPEITDIQFTVSHTVTVPNSYQSPKIWTTRLVQHEFDHVAISCDPRVIELLEHLERNLGTIERKIDGTEKPTSDLCRKIINEECALRRDAIVALVQANYKLLDRVSQHGKKRIPDRSAFFRQLFGKANLLDAQFPYLEEVLDLLKSRAYQRTKLHYKGTPNL